MLELSDRITFSIGLYHQILDHLWQSTMFAAIAALLVLALRGASARIRFWIWLAASFKFLIPFSLLVSLGGHLGWSVSSPETLRWSVAIEEISQPFTQPGVLLEIRHNRWDALPVQTIVLGIWLLGCASVLAYWLNRWQRLRRMLKNLRPLQTGREAETLRRIGARGGVRQSIRLLSSNGEIEPGVFGIWRPVLVLPAGISERLTAAQLDSIFAHELSHVRRRDNLIAAMHMVVEAAFWFNPVVWWIGARLVEERERACDEAVLEQLNERQVYAEGILKVCEYYLESSMPCVAGVTGANLKKRIEDIMTQRVARKLDLGRKALLGAVAMSAVAVPLAVGLMNAPRGRAQSTEGAGAPKQFEVASIKPSDPGVGHRVEIQMAPGGRFTAKGLSLKMLIQQAYGVRDFQIVGAPSWAATDRYDINAKGEGSIGRDDLKPMLQSLLTDRFKLVIKRETKEMPVYELVVAKGGPKLKESAAAAQGPMFRMGRGMVNAQGARMSMLANQIAQQLGRTVIDKTGLTGNYDINLEWTPDESQASLIRQMHPDAPPAPPLDSSGPSIYTALQEQLGLKLESAKGPVEILVVQSVEKPTEN